MQVYLYLKQIKIYHGSSNLVIVWIEFYFPEEIMDIVLRWADSLWQKDMKMVHKILRKKKTKNKIGLNGMGTAVSPFCISSLDLLHWPHEKGSVKEQKDR